MKAIILAAGEGKRLKKYAAGIPKGMLDFAGKSLIERQIGLFRNLGINDICVVKGFEQKKISFPGVRYYINENYARTNMLASLFCAEKELEGDLIVSYADIVLDEKLLRSMIDARGDIVVAVDIDWKRYWMLRYGSISHDTESLKLDESKGVVSLGKASPPAGEIDGRYVGLLRFSHIGTERLKYTWRKYRDDYWDRPWQVSGQPLSKAYMTDMLQALIDDGRRVDALTTKSGWIEFDTDEDYEKAVNWRNNGILPSLVRVE